ncbi:EscU/YscU/HrcU family type III secretion system export apparatus switch protein [Litchfieldella xinjiangensis]|uniref:EscU/YscU/HrcU family type III secretion system export apparatus switch protein n=1 Tax=Litchfieldella xinjiangensis TaxID=1166948 RepID=UPI0005B8E575|nr:EscU/YscU/HrcU family type III secretion system export apparatus switch protein [Halomonas xinjiangensis]
MKHDRPGRRQQAVALAYHGEDRAPRVLAKGYGELAERIIAEAGRQGIFVHDAPELVALLMQLNLDEHIPAELYQVIAELLVWVNDIAPVAARKPA